MFFLELIQKLLKFLEAIAFDELQGLIEALLNEKTSIFFISRL